MDPFTMYAAGTIVSSILGNNSAKAQAEAQRKMQEYENKQKIANAHLMYAQEARNEVVRVQNGVRQEIMMSEQQESAKAQQRVMSAFNGITASSASLSDANANIRQQYAIAKNQRMENYAIEKANYESRLVSISKGASASLNNQIIKAPSLSDTLINTGLNLATQYFTPVKK